MLVRAAKLSCPANPSAVLQSLISSKFDDIRNGRVEVSVSSSAGGSASFTIPPGMNPLEIAEAASAALTWLESQPDPANPVFTPEPGVAIVNFSQAHPW